MRGLWRLERDQRVADRGARETYASVLIANDVDREVNLNGVTIQYEFSRLVREDGNATTFTTTPVSAGDFELARDPTVAESNAESATVTVTCPSAHATPTPSRLPAAGLLLLLLPLLLLLVLVVCCCCCCPLVVCCCCRWWWWWWCCCCCCCS